MDMRLHTAVVCDKYDIGAKTAIATVARIGPDSQLAVWQRLCVVEKLVLRRQKVSVAHTGQGWIARGVARRRQTTNLEMPTSLHRVDSTVTGRLICQHILPFAIV